MTRKAADQAALIVLFVLLFDVVYTRPAYAYLDLSSASYLFQLFAGLLFALVYVVKMHWRRIIALLNSRFGRKGPHDDDQPR